MRYSKEDLARFQEEINHFYRLRRLFLIIALSCLGGALVIGLPITIAMAANNVDATIGVYIISLFISAAIALFIIRSALFNRRIRNRKIIISKINQQN